MSTLKDSTRRRSEIIQHLVKLGVPAENIDQIMDRANEYKDLNEDLDNARFTQFRPDAYVANGMMDQSPSRNAEVLTSWLRVFAEHVVGEAIHVLHSNPGMNAKEVVDRIAPMNQVKDSEAA